MTSKSSLIAISISSLIRFSTLSWAKSKTTCFQCGPPTSRNRSRRTSQLSGVRMQEQEENPQMPCLAWLYLQGRLPPTRLEIRFSQMILRVLAQFHWTTAWDAMASRPSTILSSLATQRPIPQTGGETRRVVTRVGPPTGLVPAQYLPSPSKWKNFRISSKMQIQVVKLSH